MCVREREREREREEEKAPWQGVALRNEVIKSHEMAEPELKSQNRN